MDDSGRAPAERRSHGPLVIVLVGLLLSGLPAAWFDMLEVRDKPAPG